MISGDGTKLSSQLALLTGNESLAKNMNSSVTEAIF
jgi:hypothetical protein